MSKTYYMRTSTGEVFTTSNHEWHAGCENLGTGAKGKAARQEYARAELRKLVKPGHRIYCVLRSVSKSGMSRCISLFIIQPASKGNPAGLRNIDSLVSDAIGWALTPEGIRVNGCGMDAGFHLVYTLGSALWPNGTRNPHGTRNGKPDRAGGYALKHEWI